MATGRVSFFVPWLAFLAILPTGCSQSNPFTSRQTMVGGLKASVSQLEFQNEKLKKEVADLKADNSRLDSELAREQSVNGEITARLDDAKELIRRSGGNAQALGTPSTNYEDDVIPPPVNTNPRSRTMKNTRKSPRVQIPSPDQESSESVPFGSSSDGLGYQPANRTSPDLGSDDGRDDRWLPVARGSSAVIR